MCWRRFTFFSCLLARRESRRVCVSLQQCRTTNVRSVGFILLSHNYVHRSLILKHAHAFFLWSSWCVTDGGCVSSSFRAGTRGSRHTILFYGYATLRMIGLSMFPNPFVINHAHMSNLSLLFLFPAVPVCFYTFSLPPRQDKPMVWRNQSNSSPVLYHSKTDNDSGLDGTLRRRE